MFPKSNIENHTSIFPKSYILEFDPATRVSIVILQKYSSKNGIIVLKANG